LRGIKSELRDIKSQVWLNITIQRFFSRNCMFKSCSHISKGLYCFFFISCWKQASFQIPITVGHNGSKWGQATKVYRKMAKIYRLTWLKQYRKQYRLTWVWWNSLVILSNLSTLLSWHLGTDMMLVSLIRRT